jgi:molybdenum cofactor cytidylyltransferase
MRTGVDAILMASGFSARFGAENKLLYPFRGQPLALHTLDLVCTAELFDHIYFISADAQVAALGHPYPVTPLHNARPDLGSRESVRIGVTVSTARHYMFFTCDQPLLDAGTVKDIVARRKAGRIVVPTCDDVPGSPTLFSARFREELMGLQPGQRARTVLQRHAQNVVYVPARHALALADVDTREVLQALEAAT